MPNLLVPRFRLTEYENFVTKLSDLATGKQVTSKKMKAYFDKGFSSKMRHLHPTRGATYCSLHLLQVYTTVIPELSEEDVRQQVRLYIVELWNFMVGRWSSFNHYTFYKYLLTKVSNWIGKWMASKIQSYWHGMQGTGEEPTTFIDEDLAVELNLGWTMLQERYGLFRGMSLHQKYMLYLRYTKDLTNGQIAELIGICIDKVNKNFMVINKKLRENRDG